MGDRDKLDKLNDAIQRLMNENAQTRRKVEEVEVIIRRRAPNADGLTLAAAIKTILDDRDAAFDRIAVYRKELKNAMQLILSGKVKEATQQINLFLFNNRQ